MVSLTATAQPGTASVLLEVVDAAAGPVVITRTDANGTNPVRLRDGQEPIAGQLILTDYEPALTGSLSYDLVDADNATATATAAAGLGLTLPQLHAVQLPQLAAQPQLVTGYTASRDLTRTVHRVIDRGDPLVIFGPRRTREGRLDVWCVDHDTARQVEDVLTQAKVVMLRQADHAGMDMYFTATNTRVEPLASTANGWRWQASCEYLELRKPNLPLLGAAGWSFGDVVDDYATFGAVRAAFDDFAALVAGQNFALLGAGE